MLTDEFKAMSLKDQAVIIKALRQLHKEARVEAKILKSAERAARASARQEKREQAIVRAQARLQKLLEKQAKPVGVKALKANRRPSKVVTYGAEDNQIASQIMAKKASA